MKYVLFIWRNGNEGGYDVCRSERYNDQDRIKVGEFDTASELANLLRQDDPEWFADDLHTTTTATEMLLRLWVKEEEAVH